jgi:AraC-like DNA-binding protein
LNISTRTLHRNLAAFGETFGAKLIAARADVAVRMLESPLFRRLTVAEIGRRSGFADASHFSRVLRSRTGRSPTQLRGGAGPEEESQVLDAAEAKR